MKRLLFLVLLLAVVIGLSSCAWDPDKMAWLQSQGYKVLYQIEPVSGNTSGIFLIANKDNQIGVATCTVMLRYRIPRLTKIIWLDYTISYKQFQAGGQ